MAETPILDQTTPFQSLGLNNAEDGLKCYEQIGESTIKKTFIFKRDRHASDSRWSRAVA